MILLYFYFAIRSMVLLNRFFKIPQKRLSYFHEKKLTKINALKTTGAKMHAFFRTEWISGSLALGLLAQQKQKIKNKIDRNAL